MQPKKERVIVQVKTLEEAAKVEETIGTGYSDMIAENLTNWIAVEEDVIDSYGAFPQATKAKLGGRLEGLSEESVRNVAALKAILDEVEALGRQRSERVKSLREMQRSLAG